MVLRLLCIQRETVPIPIHIAPLQRRRITRAKANKSRHCESGHAASTVSACSRVTKWNFLGFPRIADFGSRNGFVFVSPSFTA